MCSGIICLGWLVFTACLLAGKAFTCSRRRRRRRAVAGISVGVWLALAVHSCYGLLVMECQLETILSNMPPASFHLGPISTRLLHYETGSLSSTTTHRQHKHIKNLHYYQ